MRVSINLIKTVIITLVLSFSPALFPVFAQPSRGAGNVIIKKDDGKVEEVKLYKAGYALVIGVSDYTNGWQDLPGVRTDVEAVSSVLRAQGFQVTTVLNPKKAELTAAIEKFISDYGFEYENRLLFYYAGHGNTLKAGAGYEQGFIVPADAPVPKADNESEFRRYAISMDSIERYAQEINAKHALFVFDSCFSGALITRTRSSVPPAITFKSTQPVRQFITAGTDEQEVPDVSEFRKQFVAGLKGEADRNADGYITASELADFLQDTVSRYTRGSQTPQYGKIRDARLDKGDFVFILSGEPDTSASEAVAWQQLKNSTRRADFEQFIKLFPNGIYAGQAKVRYEQVWWESIRNSSVKSEFENFLKQFPAGQFAAAAELAVKRLETTSAINPEQQCFDAVGGKVAYNQAGNKSWAPENIRKLCQGTTNASATISCFQAQIRQHNDWSRGIEACKSAPGGIIAIQRPKYQEVLLSNKIWLAQNLNEPVSDSFCQDNRTENCDLLGRLYTFDGAKKACAGLGDGWRLPTGAEWKDLTRAYGNAYGDGSPDGTRAYQSLVTGGSTGFNGTFGGKRIYNGGQFYFYDFKGIGYYWADEANPGDSSQSRMFTFRSGDTMLLYESIPKTDYISARCVKD
jgi:uncharacterized protein (TIGR02145 family)